MFARAGLKFTAIFLLSIVIVFGGVTRCGVGEDHEIIATDAGANLAVLGELLDNENDDGPIITSGSSFQPCSLHHPCFAPFSTTPLVTERNSSEGSLKVYKLNRALLI